MNDAPPESIRISDDSGFYVPPYLSTSVSRAADQFLSRRANPGAGGIPPTVNFIPHTPEQAAAFRARRAAEARTQKRQPVYALRRTAAAPAPAPEIHASVVRPEPELPRRPAARASTPQRAPQVEVPVVRPAVPQAADPVPSRSRVPDPAAPAATPRRRSARMRRRPGHPMRPRRGSVQVKPNTHLARILELVETVGPITSLVASIMLGIPKGVVVSEMNYLWRQKKLLRLIRVAHTRRGGRPWIYAPAPQGGAR